ncbi:hypothetical protein QE152_g23545 [Popillia japonica]|uniref:Secreted protein n=1 Tax=Popillia japonica TaxID=7064 RepID=A0AAW1KHK5_POPJA
MINLKLILHLILNALSEKLVPLLSISPVSEWWEIAHSNIRMERSAGPSRTWAEDRNLRNCRGVFHINTCLNLFGYH